MINNLDNPKNPYKFLNLTIGKDNTKLLIKTNDRINPSTERDYSNVIPIIESLPVTE